MDAIEKRIVDLWEVREHYFGIDGKEKEEIIAVEIKEIVDALKEVQQAQQKMCSTDRARLAYLNGRALDSSSGYNNQAEEALCRAVKLAPEAVEAWNALGHVLWKKGAIEAAKDCFESGLNARANAIGHRYLSMVIRIGTGDMLTQKNQAIQHARSAVELQIDNPDNWYALGNCYVARYFDAAGGRNGADLQHATRVYARAEILYDNFSTKKRKNEIIAKCTKTNLVFGNPDLYFNRGHLRKYIEAYHLAATDFNKAHSLDQALKANDLEEDCSRWTKRISELVKKKAQLKPKKKKELVDKLIHLSQDNFITIDSLPIATDSLAGFLSAPSSSYEDKKCIIAVIALELRRDTPDVFLAAVHNPINPQDPHFITLSFFDADTKALVPGTALFIREPTRFHVAQHDDDDSSCGYDALRIVHAPSCLLEGQTPLQTTFQAVSTGKML
uniref:Tetratricopeptide repeat protein 5 OB fold domain-containing protein n=1 Tax=Aureoumbra lagunensis TaxID=44058 RepID=A0A7S3K1S3_9STRA